MQNTLVGIVTFGNLAFTELAIRSIKETTKTESLDFYVIVGKPDDKTTLEYLKKNNIPYKYHTVNNGFPASLNDIYDYAWKDNNYSNLIIAGNDIIAYPEAIDSLLQVANTTDYEWVSALEYNVKDLIKEFPNAASSFSGDNFKINNFSSKPWELFKGYSNINTILDNNALDVHNLCLFKKSVMDKIGYIDTNFYPAYFEDNDYIRRASFAKIKNCTLSNARYFHFWSRTIHQGSGGSTNKFFNLNAKFYKDKWGGEPGHETFTIPFNGKAFPLTHGLDLPPVLNIVSRDLEPHTVNYWRSIGN